MPNTYAKYCPNVYVAKCDAPHEKGETILVETKHGKLIVTYDGKETLPPIKKK